MKTSKPDQLISLLKQIVATDDKQTIGSLYIDIATETMNVRFVELPNQHFDSLIFKNLIRLALKAYVHEDRSKESIAYINDTIEILEKTDIYID